MTEGALFQAKTTAGETVFLNDSLPLLPVRDAVVFPGMTIPLAVGRQASLAALDAAGAGGPLSPLAAALAYEAETLAFRVRRIAVR